MRMHSNYPTFRSVVGLFAWVGYLIAALVAIGSFISMVKMNVASGLMGLAFALLLLICTRVSKEASLMLADGSDALVRMAARQEQR